MQENDTSGNDISRFHCIMHNCLCRSYSRERIIWYNQEYVVLKNRFCFDSNATLLLDL
jgi:hypothetical protein